MVDIKPFRGWLYDESKAGDISCLVAPPHDVISDEEQDALYKRSKHNSVRLVLPKSGHGEAREKLEEFISSGAVVRDEAPAYYIYEQESLHGGKVSNRLGFIALVKAGPLGEDVLPHEMIFPDRAEDRFNLFLEAMADTSPVFGLYEGDAELRKRLESVRKSKPLFEFRDGQGVINRMWPLRDKAALDAITKAFKGRKIIIADGHHRYTAASNLAKLKGIDTDAGYVMAYLADIDDPALSVLPTHRLVKHRDFDLDAFLEKASGLFHVSRHGDIYSLEDALSESGKHAFGVHTKGNSYILKLKDPSVVETLVPGGKSRDWKNLDVSVLHHIVIDRLMPANGDITFTKHREDVIELIDSGEYHVALLLRHADVSEVAKIAKNGELMPHKSTYFYPKPLAGMVIRRIGVE